MPQHTRVEQIGAASADLGRGRRLGSLTADSSQDWQSIATIEVCEHAYAYGKVSRQCEQVG